MTRFGKTTSFKAKDGAEISAYHAEARGARKGGLVVVQEIFGVTDHIRDVCDSYAAEGFEVLAPSLFDRQEKGFEASYEQPGIQRAMALRAKNDIAVSLQDIQLCIDRLKTKGPVFIVGYCYGGSIVWLACCRLSGLAAGSAYYGALIPQHAHEKPRCPLILHFGKTDRGIPLDGVEKVRAAHPEVPVYLYDAGHGFNSDRRPDYHAPSAALARSRTLELFARAAR